MKLGQKNLEVGTGIAWSGRLELANRHKPHVVRAARGVLLAKEKHSRAWPAVALLSSLARRPVSHICSVVVEDDILSVAQVHAGLIVHACCASSVLNPAR